MRMCFGTQRYTIFENNVKENTIVNQFHQKMRIFCEIFVTEQRLVVGNATLNT